MTVFITSTGTEQGKTYVTQLLCLQQPGIKAIKPVLSGYEGYEGSDAAQILAAMGKGAEALERCSPWRYQAPLSPEYAAQLEGREIPYDEVLAFCRTSQPDIIEGAGGVMSPIAPHKTNLDLIVDTQSAAILVSSLYLGCISHILTALEVLALRKVPVRALVLSPVQAQSMAFETVNASLQPQLPPDLPVITLKYLQNPLSSWQAQPDLSKVSLS